MRFQQSGGYITYQVANNEITVMKEELVTLRQDKLSQTTKVAQLKSALKASVVHSKVRHSYLWTTECIEPKNVDH